jgi:protein-S-isoprenylcysteine O-methyltransferase Ste14
MDAMRICSNLWMALGLIWLVAMVRTKRTQQRAGSADRALYGFLVVAAFIAIFADWRVLEPLNRSLWPRNPALDAFGTAITVVGLAFAVWARFYLGTNWSSAVSIKVGHELIRSGPYRWVRHPIYSGLLLAMLGTGIVRGELRSVVAFVLLYIGFWVKMRIEDEFMAKTFGEQYQNYALSTGALFPRLRS